MPEPSGVGEDTAVSCNWRARRPRPTPRLSLTAPKNDALLHGDDEAPSYENIVGDGWRLAGDPAGQKGTKTAMEEESSNEKHAAAAARGGAAVVRRTTLPLAPSALHSNIPVPRRVGGTATSPRNCDKSAPASAAKTQGRGGPGSTGSGSVKCMPYNSPRLAPKSSRGPSLLSGQPNGHLCKAAKGVSKIVIAAPKLVSSESSSLTSARFRVTEKERLSGSLDYVPLARDSSGGKRVAAGALQSPRATTQLKQSAVMARDRNALLRRSCGAASDILAQFPVGCARSMDSLTTTTFTDGTEVDGGDARKAEYRKSVSIPPDLVANMTCKFNALIEKNHGSSTTTTTTCSGHKSELPVLISSNAKITTTVTVSIETSMLTTILSCPSSPMHVKGNSIIGGSSKAKPPRTFGQRLMSRDRGYVSATDGTESSDAESLGKEEELFVKPWLHTLRPVESTIECVAPLPLEVAAAAVSANNDDDDVGGSERLSLVKQAVRNYEVALLKSSTSSPELQRKPSLPRTSGPRQSHTLPTTVSSRLPNSLPCALNTAAVSSTLPNTSFRTSFRTSRDDETSTASSLPQCGSATALRPRELSGLSSTVADRSRAVSASCVRHGEALASTCPAKLIPPVPTANPETVSERALLRKVTDSRRLHELSKPAVAAAAAAAKAADSLARKSVPERDVFHAKPAIVMDHGDVESVVGSANVSPLSSPKVSANSRGRFLFQKCATVHVDSESVTSARSIFPKDVAGSTAADGRSSSLERPALLSDMGSMDLLAEIDSHPSLLAASTRCRGPWSTSSAGSGDPGLPSASGPTRGSSGSSVVPNASFLWKDSTQSLVSQDLPSTLSNGLLANEKDAVEVIARGPGEQDSVKTGTTAISPYDSLEEPLYEELTNCTSALTFPPRIYVPLAFQEETDDSMSSSSSSWNPETSSREALSFDLNAEEAFRKVDSQHENGSVDGTGQVDSDGNWTDDSESDEGVNEMKASSLSSVGKAKVRTKKQGSSRRAAGLVRRSWSQSLRDLVNAHENEGTAREYLVSGGWEEEFVLDEITDDMNAVSTTKKSNKELATTSSETDSDRSPPSANGVVASDVFLNMKDMSGKDSKSKKVKRNWSWSKADFRLDISSKLGKIRLTNNAKRRPVTLPEEVGDFGEAGTVDLSPTKKTKQWSFKTKFVTKKGSGGRISPKKSPTKENAQFYVPSYNEDGTLAVSPCCDLLVEDIIRSAASLDSCRTAPEDGAVNAAGSRGSQRARRASIVGTLTRPKTAPPAPPVLLTKATAAVGGVTSASLPPLPQLNVQCDSRVGLKTRSDSPSERGSVCRLNSVDSETGSEKSVKTELAPEASVGCRAPSVLLSSDGDSVITGAVRERTSDHSESSVDGCACAGADEIPSRLPQSGSVNGDVAHDKSGSFGRREKIPQLDFETTFAPDASRMSKLSPFEDEPLYQFYNMAARLRAARENQIEESEEEEEDDADGCYESIYQMLQGDDDDDHNGDKMVGRAKPSAMDLVRSTDGGMRTLWCEVPEVKSSGILDSMSSPQRKLQEVMFEVITSEASYLKSLNVLVECFIHCPQLSDDYSMDCVLSKRERHVLFSDVIPVKETSERLLADLEKRWQESIVISDICDVLLEHATKNFDVYVKYCSNQLYQDRCLKKLKETNPQFVEVLQRLEANPMCQNLSMYSFLMLPMQRITRLPLLVDAIFNRLEFGTKQYETCKQALATLNKIVHECNEGAHRMERMEEMLIISRQLDFRECRCLALISASRWLVKKGELTRLVFGDSSSKLSFGRRCARQSVYLFLFTDLLIVTKKKSDDCYNVLDYCPRNLVQAAEIESPEQLPGRTHDGHRDIFQLSMLQNHDNKTVEMFFCCQKESDLTRWVEAVTPRKSENPDERIYEEWDCPQVQAIHAYVAQQPDELSLEESDVVNVFRKMADGWYQGERIRDGVQGWFPSNYTVEIVSSHIRARNLRQRYRLLALSHSYVEKQRKKELLCTKGK